MIGHHRRLQQTRHYSVLHSRYHDNADMVTNLLEESDDDDALINPSNLEYNPPHRLALNDQDDDDDPLCMSLLCCVSPMCHNCETPWL